MEFEEISMVSGTLDYLEKIAHPDTSTSELTMLSQYVMLLKRNQINIYDWLVHFEKELEKLKEERKDGDGYE